MKNLLARKRRTFTMFLIAALLLNVLILPAAGRTSRAVSLPSPLGGTNAPANIDAQKISGFDQPLWQEINKDSALALQSEAVAPDRPAAYRSLTLNKEKLAEILRQAPMEMSSQAEQKEVLLAVPLPDGGFSQFRIEEAPVMQPGLAAQYPDFTSYRGQGIDDPTATLQCSWSPSGFHAQIISSSGMIYIDPLNGNDVEHYMVYHRSDYAGSGQLLHCNSDLFNQEKNGTASLPKITAGGEAKITFSSATGLRTYRLAMAATGEFTQYHCTKDPNNPCASDAVAKQRALDAISVGVQRINGIYEREVGVKFTLVNNNLNIIYTNPATDPYSSTVPQDGDIDTPLINENQANLSNPATIGGIGAFDIGHLVSPLGAGLAASPSTCDSDAKAQGKSGIEKPEGDPFFVDYVAHEIGHQFGAAHSYNGKQTKEEGGCTTRSVNDAYEPASGSTIMSYTGICGTLDLQKNADPMFNARSLQVMLGYINNGAGSCAAAVTNNNTAPTVNAGSDYNIPRSTPFTLTGSATDPNGDTLTYSWEEYDLPAAADTAPPHTDADGKQRPIFRVYNPTTSPSRTFPSLGYILNNANNPPATYAGTNPVTGAICEDGKNCVTGEVLPAIERAMNFQLVVRDSRAGGGGVATAGMKVNVSAGAGPFLVTQPNTAVNWAGASTQTVTWDVANTTAAPINAANVKISLSTDGGLTFPTVLAASTPNDGSEAITVPNTATTAARIKVEAVGNIFFDISNASFTISATNNDSLQFSASSYSVIENAGTATVTVNRTGGASGAVSVNYATSNGTATAGQDYTTTTGTLNFQNGDLSKTFTVPILDDTVQETNETINLTLSNPGGAATLGAQATAILTIMDNDASMLQLNQNAFNIAEGAGSLAFAVNRSGDLSTPISVNYATSDASDYLQNCNVVNGKATSRCDYVQILGTLRFAAGESSKTLFLPIGDDTYLEGSETFTITLSNPTGGAALGTDKSATVTITDNGNDVAGQANLIDNATFFVRQHYIDFLGRDPDSLSVGWVNQLNQCAQGDQSCRLSVSQGIYNSPEFRDRGYFIYKFYSVALGRKPSYDEFTVDRARVSGFQTEAELEQSKLDFIANFMVRAEFANIYNQLSNNAYVQQLYTTAGVTQVTVNGVVLNLTAMQQSLTNGKTRGQVLREIAESPEVTAKFLTESTVVMHYFGYLRRDPDAAYQGWINTLTQTGDSKNVTNGFMNSTEYRLRFGQ